VTVAAGAARRTDLAVRVIPCLDVADGVVVKGVRFEGLEALGSPADAAARYAAEGADEIVFLDIAASHERRGPELDWMRAVAERVFVPLTVGGGVRAVDDARDLLLAGADKVAVNSAAVARPELLTELAERYGRQCVVLSVDARRRGAPASDGWEVVTHGGRRATGRDALEWVREGVERGAGELLLTSIDRDGTGSGFDLELLAAASRAVNVPVIASGGAGRATDFAAALHAGAAAVLAAGVFHRREIGVAELKARLAAEGFAVRRGR
jgi:cyclase